MSDGYIGPLKYFEVPGGRIYLGGREGDMVFTPLSQTYTNGFHDGKKKALKDIPWEEIEERVNFYDAEGRKGKGSDLLRKILALREQGEGDE